VLARSAASLDILSGGRVELGLGAGAFWDPIVANGGRRLTPGQSVDALAEAIEIIRAIWGGGTIRLDGEHYQVHGAKPGPPPRHPIEIWLGAYKPRMLRLTGAKADGWLPSMGYVELDDLPRMNAAIDEAAREAGRVPAEIRRMLNVNPGIGTDDLARLAEQGFSTFIMSVQSGDDVRAFAEETAPAVRDLVLSGAPRKTAPQQPDHRGAGQHLIDVHDGLRAELERLRDLIAQVAAGHRDPAAVRSFINRMTIRQNGWTLGAFCASYCRIVAGHHTLEDRSIFPHLRSRDADLAPVIDRLEDEHEVIADMLERVDQTLVALVSDGRDGMDEVRAVMDLFGDALLSHLSYEERELVEPLARLGFY
jgi:alkanesulfonate monooxygenase SsuD/methylene tetrahydromethanopterin reductase-like flavin-dependent oxidoreductase (luciferase family)